MFSLILVRCNYRRMRDRILTTLKPQLSFALSEVCLTPRTKTLFTAIRQMLGTESPKALMVYGLETVENLSELLRVANQSREEFRNHLACPLAIWITDDILRRLIREATDFESWASITIAFESDLEELSQLILETAENLFAQLLNSRENAFLNNHDLHLEEQSPLRLELRAACQELHHRLDPLPVELAASGQFILGRVANNNGEAAREHYERSLELWRQAENLERYAHVQFYLGFWWGNYAVRHLSDRPHGLRQSRLYLEGSMATFKQIGHDHRIAQFINFLGEVLHRQQDWEALGRLAYDAFLLHQRHCNYFRQAKALGLMAEVAIAKPHWSQAEHLAKRALATWQEAAATLPHKSDRQAFLIWERSFHCPWYLYSLGKAKRHTDQLEEAAQHLEEARKIARPSYDPDLYTRILNELREIYFTQKHYLAAYRTRQDRRDIQSKFNLRAFTGPGRLQASQEITNPALPTAESLDQIAPEIRASGRQQTIADLLKRTERKDYRLTVIYGPSGVGKSSILQAGLIPALKQQTFDGRRVIPVLQQIYTDWLGNLNTQLQSACQEFGTSHSTPVPASDSTILQQLQTNSHNNLKTILIFDQFEEFFFANPNVRDRRNFYDLIVECFKILDVDIILSMREDYLHYLLVCNRLSGLDIIGNNILDKSILYEIGNFSPEAAHNIIRDRTTKTQFQFADDLISQLVKDLTDEFGEVRPIEMQIVGAQLQTDNITNLEAYLALANSSSDSKEVLVERYLENVVKDCGPENQEVAEVVLYLLTSEDGTRPIKTKSELAEEKLYLAIQSNLEKLSLVLEIFVRSGIVLLLPSSPTDSYQLVHDYLVSTVRQRVETSRMENLQDELVRQQGQISQQRGQIRRLGMAMLATAIAATAISGFLVSNIRLFQILDIERKSISSLRKSDGYTIGGLRLALETGLYAQQEEIYKFSNNTFLALQEVLENAYEKNFFNTNQQAIYWAYYIPKNQVIATAGEDGTIVLSNLKGQPCDAGNADCALRDAYAQFKAWLEADQTQYFHDAEFPTERIYNIDFHDQSNQLTFSLDTGRTYVWRIDDSDNPLVWNAYPEETFFKRFTHAIFSPDGTQVITGSFEGLIRVWNPDEATTAGTEFEWYAHQDSGIAGMRFSPSGETLITQGQDGQVRLWNWSDRLSADQLPTNRISLQNQAGTPIYSVAVSPASDQQVEGQYLVTAENEGSFQIWSLNSDGTAYTLQREFAQTHREQVSAVEFSVDGQLLATADGVGTIKLWHFKDGKVTLITTLRGHQNWIWNLQFVSIDGKHQLISGSVDGTVRIWDLAKVSQGPDNQLAQIKGLDRPGVVWSTQFRPGNKNAGDRETLIAAGDDGRLTVWELSAQDSSSELSPLLSEKVTHRQVVPSNLLEFDVQPSVYWATFADINFAGADTADAVPSGILTADYGGNIAVWQLDSTGLEKIDSVASGAAMNSVAYNKHHQLIASADTKGQVTLFQLNSEGSLETLKLLPTGEQDLFAVAFRSDGKYLAAAGGDGHIYLWEVEHLLAATATTTITPDKIFAHEGGTSFVSFSPNNRWLASGGEDGSVVLWSIAGNSQQPLQRVSELAGHRQRITWVEFDQNSQYLATASKDGSVIVWNYQQQPGLLLRRNRQFIRQYEFRGHEDGAFSVSFNHQGDKLAVAQGNGDIKVWQLETLQALINRGCAWLQDGYFETHGGEKEVEKLIEACS